MHARRFTKLRCGLVGLLTLVMALGIVPVAPGTGQTVVEPPAPGIASVAPDAYEVDNTQAQAKKIDVGGLPQSRTVHALDNIDWVKFMGKAGSTYVIDPGYPGGGLGPSGAGIARAMPGAWVGLELYDASGNLLSGQDTIYLFASGEKARQKAAPGVDAGFDPHGRLVYTVAKDQMLYVRVAPISLPYYWWEGYPGLGAYTLQVRTARAAISGRVTGPEGQPLPLTAVYAYSLAGGKDARSKVEDSMGESWTLTDNSGYYTMPDLGAGAYALEFYPGFDSALYQWEYYDDTTNPASITPVAVGNVGVTRGINAQLGYTTPGVKGTIVDESGNPVSDVRARAYYWDGSGWSDTGHSDLVDENGVYEIRSLRYWGGTVRVGFFDENPAGERYATEFWDDAATVDGATTISLVDGIASGTYDATLSARPMLASGMVTDGSSGEPVEGVEVAIYDQFGSWLDSMLTGADGKWFFSGSGTRNVKVRYWDNQYRYQWEYDSNTTSFDAATTFALDSNAPASIDESLAPLSPTVHGKVTDALTGKPVAGERVSLYVSYNGAYRALDMTTTDSMGHYRFQYAGNWHAKVQFADPKGFYATEWFDDMPSMYTADSVWLTTGGNAQADAALMPKDGRVYGGDRYSNAVVIAEQQWPKWEGVSHVIVASGEDRAAADPLSAASLCWAYEAPLLLTKSNGNPAALTSALKAIMAKNTVTKTGVEPAKVQVHVVGGPASVPQANLVELGSIVGTANVERLPYGDRYETARQVAIRAHAVALGRGEDPGLAFVANGAETEKFYDALSASAIAGHIGAPILLTKADGLPLATERALADLDEPAVVVVGGTASVSQGVYNDLAAVERIAGADRYKTSVAIADRAAAQGWLNLDRVGVASKIPDAVTGGALVGLKTGGPLVVTAPTALPAPVYQFFDRWDQTIQQVYIFGGPNSVSANVKTQINKALAQ